MNNIKVNQKLEKRFSVKILSNKVRTYFPNWVYEIILKIRLFFFINNCSGSDFRTLVYSDGSWINRKTTSDLKLIQKYITSKKYKTILQVGTGNMSLYKSANKSFEIFYGITILQEELNYGKDVLIKNHDTRSKILFWNKYSGDFRFLKGNRVDLIIDNDLSSYACCKYHFKKMVSAYSEILQNNGLILVGLKGLGYFDNGFGLTTKTLSRFIEPYGLKVKKTDFCYEIKKIN